jgi:hypothetical protein
MQEYLLRVAQALPQSSERSKAKQPFVPDTIRLFARSRRRRVVLRGGGRVERGGWRGGGRQGMGAAAKLTQLPRTEDCGTVEVGGEVKVEQGMKLCGRLC